MGKFALACAALALSLIQPALAQSIPETQDIRCVVISIRMLGSGNDTEKSAALVAVMYFLGKLDGRSPGLDLEKAIISQVDAMKPDDAKAEAVRCGTEMQERGKSLETIGTALTKKGY